MLPWVSCELLHWGSPVCWLGTSTWSPPKSLAWQKGFRLGSGLLLKLLGLWLVVSSLLPLASAPGILLAVTGGTSWLVDPLLLLLLFFLVRFSLTGALLLILLLGPYLIAVGGLAGLLSPFGVLLSGLLLGCLLLVRVGGLSRSRFRGCGRFMMIVYSSCQGTMLCSWMRRWMLIRFLVHDLSGLVLLRLHLLMLFGLVEVLSPLGAWFLDGGVLCSGLSGWGVTRCGRLGVMLLMYSYTATLLLLPCWT